MDKTQPHPLFKLATELGPLIVFFFVNAKFNLFVATGAFMVAIVAAMVASYVVTRHVPMMAIVTGVVVLVFGTLTLVLHDETFIKVKPTIIYGLFAAVLGGGLLFGRSFIAIMFDQMFNLTPQGWRILTLRWALFFFAMAVLNEIIWRTQSTDFWVGFKVFGVMPLTMVFAIDADAADQALSSRAGVAGGERGRGRCEQGVSPHGDEARCAVSNCGPRSPDLRDATSPLSDGLPPALSRSRASARVDIVRRDRADQLVDDRAVAADDECFRHAVDAPFDRGAAVAVDADGAERIAVAAEEAPRVVGRVLVVDADHLQALVLAELGAAAAPRHGTARTRTPRR